MTKSSGVRRLALALSLGSLGKCAADAESLKTEIVLAHHHEDLGWVSHYTGKDNLKVSIYSKGEELPAVDGASTMPLPNVGRE
eukprot:CAMPEP_0177240728 /NCGR_PEP_ID=MMETSP0367-20130122/47873_1 /TAXON_ID=447022 ORGANISM="Scrippsiella hangoei-like, Strain SHHI-4" /NCGR_SAMPLE_ID=MMETSP0367 /ASSEMBLY_ACC=CAM_ASM_000362 /LENGTH=82 /DNA_ID=CAMNT_0018692185 /DNA_START=57 /DNA_END=302 /DNA_ORIENTATION=-